MPGETVTDRVVADLAGRDALPFLQGLVTNDVLPLAKGPGVVWTALLTAQGKYLADFFVVNTGARLLLDLPASIADATLRRLSMYRLRAEVTIAPMVLGVSRGLGEGPPGSLADPRHPALGWRGYGIAGAGAAMIDWTAIRVENLIPETGAELVPDESYILEMGFERLHGVDFRKGCYVGQEVTARMKHKTELRKGLIRVQVDGHAPVGTMVLSGGKEAGTLYSQSHGLGIAWLRYDRAGADMTAGDARLRLTEGS